MKNFFSILTLFALTLLLTGCPPRPAEPDPSMTAVGSSAGARGAGAGAGDWLNPADLEGAGGDLGLLARGGQGGFADGDQIRDLLPSVFFDFDQFAIRPADRAALQTAAAHMAANPSDRLLIEGHCDWRGTTEYNMVLGERRASSVRQFLINLGVDSSRMETVSFGDLKATKEGTEAQMARDRRADLVIVR
ncbi:MAG: OmpA family protein [Verrucomicrobia bacterium]|nr:OmpA family protein [Verrucomicrobiota bacterium]